MNQNKIETEQLLLPGYILFCFVYAVSICFIFSKNKSIFTWKESSQSETPLLNEDFGLEAILPSEEGSVTGFIELSFTGLSKVPL